MDDSSCRWRWRRRRPRSVTPSTCSRVPRASPASPVDRLDVPHQRHPPDGHPHAGRGRAHLLRADVVRTIGNAWVAPAVPTAPPPSPDVWTVNDIDNGAIGASTLSARHGPGVLPGLPRVGRGRVARGLELHQRLPVPVAHEPARARPERARGRHQLLRVLRGRRGGGHERGRHRRVSSRRSTRPIGARTMRPSSCRSTSGESAASQPRLPALNTGIFHPTRDFDLAPVTWGGLRWQGYGCRGQMYRPVESPCFLERGIPIGMQFVVQDAVHQASMLEALTINNEPFGTNVLPDVNVTAGPTQTSHYCDAGADARHYAGVRRAAGLRRQPGLQGRHPEARHQAEGLGDARRLEGVLPEQRHRGHGAPDGRLIETRELT